MNGRFIRFQSMGYPSHDAVEVTLLVTAFTLSLVTMSIKKSEKSFFARREVLIKYRHREHVKIS